MRIAHESMNCIFPTVQALTEYDYCLVHLLDESQDYLDNFYRASNDGREIILDNSIFELGEAYDEERYWFWIRDLQPTWTIIPDVLNDKDGTLKRLNEWFEKYPLTSSHTKPIAVVQGKNESEALACFDKLQRDPRVEKIGISFDSASHIHDKNMSKDELMHTHMKGRIDFLNKATNYGSSRDMMKPVHLLGCSLPQEVRYYNKYDSNVIDSIDTSSPIIHGFFGIKYEEVGLAKKHPQKLFELINEDVTLDQMSLMTYNMWKFRKFANG